MKPKCADLLSGLTPQAGIFRPLFLVACASLLLCLAPRAQAAGIRAFPGAEGAGAYSAGGRGGDVYHVTNLQDEDASGNKIPGSLRYGIDNATGPRTIVFDVGGWIQLTSKMDIDRTKLTLAGQTAPGDGIGVRNFSVSPEANDLIIRYMRFATGYGSYNSNNANDCLTIASGTNMIFDHLSAQFGGDETISSTHQPWNETIQWCLMSDSLNFQQHGYGSLIAPELNGTRISMHHNLYSNNDGRDPRMGTRNFATNFVCDFVNNVKYNWGSQGDWGGWGVVGGNPNEETLDLNYINNYSIAGASTTGTSGTLSKAKVALSSNFATTRIWQAGNLIDSDKDANRNGTDTGWAQFAGTYVKMPSPFPIDPTNAITTTDARTAYLEVLCKVGAYLNRDSADIRAVNYVRNQTGANINYPTNVASYPSTDSNGFPILNSALNPRDTDGDGMPDYWEIAVGLNTNVADNNLDRNGSGYTELENYLNWLAGPHATGNANGILNVDLRTMMGLSSNTVSFTVQNPTNGTVTLLGDGYTARFVPPTNYMGLASFDFTAIDVGTTVSLGTSTLVAVITPTNTPPMLNLPVNTSIQAGLQLSARFSAIDNDQPPQTLTLSIPNPPAGASLNSSNSTFTWRPTMAQAGTNIIPVVVTDNGSPSLATTQNFTVVVTLPKQPTIQGVLTTNHVSLTVTGSYGPDYYIEASTNLVNHSGWVTVFGTNAPFLPVHWTDTNKANSISRRYYRVRLGP